MFLLWVQQESTSGAEWVLTGTVWLWNRDSTGTGRVHLVSYGSGKGQVVTVIPMQTYYKYYAYAHLMALNM